jgi:hypothetical protein
MTQSMHRGIKIRKFRSDKRDNRAKTQCEIERRMARQNKGV